jgi:PAS domain S-box-containing protein
MSLPESESAWLKKGAESGGVWQVGVVLVAGLLATALAAHYVKSNTDAVAKREFDHVCHEIQTKIVDRLDAHAQILRSGAAFYENGDRVDRAKWKRYTERQNVAQHLPGIQGFGFVLLIPREQLAEHVREIRAEGFPEYSVHPEGDREVYSSIIYLEPFGDRNLRAFGYDMLSEAVRREAMERARDRDAPALTGKVRLVQETDEDIQAGTLMYVPAYRREMPSTTVDQRRAALMGWVYSPYRMNDLMRGILGEWNLTKDRYLRLEVFDGDQAQQRTLLYDSLSAETNQVGPAQEMTAQGVFDAAGRQWFLRFTQVRSYGGGLPSPNVWLVALGGGIISLLLSGLLYSLFNVRVRARQMAAQLTTKLRASEYRWKFAIEGTGDGLWDWNVPESTVFFSTRWKEMLGFAEDEIGSDLSEWSDRVHADDLARVMVDVQAHLAGTTRYYSNEHRVRCKDGIWKWLLDRGVVVSRDDAGKPLRMIGTHTDMTERKRAEEHLAASLKEKEVLLREIHHRVKNNMQVIVSLLRMHARRTTDKEVQSAFDDCRDRVNAMALIHEALYQSDNLAQIDFEVYLKKLCHNLSVAHGTSGKGIAVTVGQCNMTLSTDKGIAVGMVIAELVSNAFKHAFPPKKGGQISVSLSNLDEDTVELIVQDNGIGLPAEVDVLNSPSLGLRLVVAAVTRELGGSIEVTRDGGTRFVIRFACEIS